MNKNSVLCNFIISNGSAWKDELAKKNISIKEDGRLVIFNYNKECDFADPVVQESRGIIIDIEEMEVVCWPFRKFGNYGEGYADDIDWNTARVQEKIDGSIIKLWYNNFTDRWQWSTNSMIDANDAMIMDASVSFMALISRSYNFKNIPYSSLDKNKTYIFELVAPEQKIVIRYDIPYLYHIGTRSNLTGMESNDDIGIKKPEEYSLHSIKDCIRAAEGLNTDEDNVTHEGFVVVDGNWNRVKVKSPEYVYAHRLETLHVYTKRRLLPLIRVNDKAIDVLLEKDAYSEVYIRYYQLKYAELKRDVRIAITKTRSMYEEFEHDRKCLAGYLRNEPLQKFCFKAIDNNKSADDIVAEMNDSTIERLIPDYQDNRSIDQ